MAHANRKYGTPLYGVAWPPGGHILVAGGGGKSSSGIPNRVMAVAVESPTSSSSKNPLAADPAVALGTAATPLRLLLAPDGTSAALALAGGILTVLTVDASTSPPTLAAGGGGGPATKGGDNNPSSPAIAAAKRASTDLNRSSPGAAAARAVVGLAGAVGGALATPGRALLGRGRGTSSGSAEAGSAALPSVSLGSEVKCLAFDSSGHTLAAGCEDGTIRFLAWPSLAAAGQQVKPASPADEAAAAALAAGTPPIPGGPRPRPPGTHDGVRDLDFAPGAASALVVVWESGGARLVARDGGAAGPALPIAHPAILAAAAKVPPARRGVAGAGRPVIGRARFEVGAAASAPAPRLLATVAAGGRGWVAAWEQTEGGVFTPIAGRSGAVAALPSPATAFALSACGTSAAVGSADGDVALVDAGSLGLVSAKSAHMVFVTALAFEAGGGEKTGCRPALVSVSGDASAVVTRAGGRRSMVAGLVVVLVLVLLLLLLASSSSHTASSFSPDKIVAAFKAEVEGVRAAVGGGRDGGSRFAVAGDKGEL